MCVCVCVCLSYPGVSSTCHRAGTHVLLASSYDGTLAMLQFESTELGQPLSAVEQQTVLRDKVGGGGGGAGCGLVCKLDVRVA